MLRRAEAKKGPPLRPLRQEITDLPNLITLVRIGLIPLILVFIDNQSRSLSLIAAAIFAVAAVTDFLDGYLARRLGLVTVVGKFLDPLADKLIVLSTLVMLVEKGRAPAWLVIVLMTRELAITGLRAIASQQGLVIAAGAGGKAKTALQLFGVGALLIYFEYSLPFGGTLDFHPVGIVLLYISLVMSVLSAIEYLRFFVRAATIQAAELAEQGITRESLRQQARERRERRRALGRGLRRFKLRSRAERAAARRERTRLRRSRGRSRRKHGSS